MLDTNHASCIHGGVAAKEFLGNRNSSTGFSVAGLYRDGVCKSIIMSNCFEVPGVLSTTKLESNRSPLCTNTPLLRLLAKVKLKSTWEVGIVASRTSLLIIVRLNTLPLWSGLNVIGVTRAEPPVTPVYWEAE